MIPEQKKKQIEELLETHGLKGLWEMVEDKIVKSPKDVTKLSQVFRYALEYHVQRKAGEHEQSMQVDRSPKTSSVEERGSQKTEDIVAETGPPMKKKTPTKVILGSVALVVLAVSGFYQWSFDSNINLNKEVPAFNPETDPFEGLYDLKHLPAFESYFQCSNLGEVKSMFKGWVWGGKEFIHDFSNYSSTLSELKQYGLSSQKRAEKIMLNGPDRIKAGEFKMFPMKNGFELLGRLNPKTGDLVFLMLGEPNGRPIAVSGIISEKSEGDVLIQDLSKDRSDALVYLQERLVSRSFFTEKKGYFLTNSERTTRIDSHRFILEGKPFSVAFLNVRNKNPSFMVTSNPKTGKVNGMDFMADTDHDVLLFPDKKNSYIALIENDIPVELSIQKNNPLYFEMQSYLRPYSANDYNIVGHRIPKVIATGKTKHLTSEINSHMKSLDSYESVFKKTLELNDLTVKEMITRCGGSAKWLSLIKNRINGKELGEKSKSRMAEF